MKTLSHFFIAALLGFVACLPGVARCYSARTLPGPGCNPSYQSWNQVTAYTCGVPSGSDFPTANLAGAYIDFYTNGGAGTHQTSFQLVKTSYTGTTYADGVNPGTAPGYHEVFVTAVAVKINPSIWDYVSVAGTSDDLIGVGLETQ
jgi:hypothetical protein